MSKRYDDALGFLERSEAWLDRTFGPDETSRGYFVSPLFLQRRMENQAAAELRALILVTPGIANLFRVFPFA